MVERHFRGGKRFNRGMTLIEVMVALAILSLIATGTLSLVSQNTRFIASIEDRMLASILADNLMVTELVSSKAMSDSESVFGCSIALREWECTRTMTNLKSIGVARIDVSVSSLETGQQLAKISTMKKIP